MWFDERPYFKGLDNPIVVRDYKKIILTFTFIILGLFSIINSTGAVDDDQKWYPGVGVGDVPNSNAPLDRIQIMMQRIQLTIKRVEL